MSVTAPAKPRTKPANATSTPTEKPKRVMRPAVVTELDFSDAVDADTLPEAPPAVTGITRILADLRAATVKGLVPRDSLGALKFLKIVESVNASGAQTTLRNLRQKPEKVPGGIDVWEFRKVNTFAEDGTAGSILRARYVGPVGDDDFVDESQRQADEDAGDDE